MEARARPSVEQVPHKRARGVIRSGTVLPPLPDSVVTFILRMLPLATQIRSIPLVSRAWNAIFWGSVVEHLDFQPFKEKITDGIAIRVLSKCTSLQTLSLKHCGVTDECLAKLPSQLKQLDLSWCNKLSPEAFRTLPPLHTLCLSWCNNVKDASLRALPVSLTALRLGGCADITDDGLKHLERLPSLISLQVSGCDKISNRLITYLPPTLRVLEVFTCPNITDEDLHKLPPTIRTLHRCFFAHTYEDVLGRAWPELSVSRNGISTAVSKAKHAALASYLPSPPMGLKPQARTLASLTPLPPLHLHPTPTPPTALAAPLHTPQYVPGTAVGALPALHAPPPAAAVPPSALTAPGGLAFGSTPSLAAPRSCTRSQSTSPATPKDPHR